MVHTHYDMMISMKEAVDVFVQLHTKNLEHKTLLSSKFVTLKYIDYI